jgi:hypothetical protein
MINSALINLDSIIIYLYKDWRKFQAIDQDVIKQYSLEEFNKNTILMKSIQRLKHFTLTCTILLGVLMIFETSFGQPFLATPKVYAAATVTCPSGQVLQADGQTCCHGLSNQQNATACFFDKYVTPVIQLLSAAVGLVAVVAIITGAIEYITSAGDPQRTAAGKTHITNALLGILAYAFLYAFLQFLIPGGLFNGG